MTSTLGADDKLSMRSISCSPDRGPMYSTPLKQRRGRQVPNVGSASRGPEVDRTAERSDLRSNSISPDAAEALPGTFESRVREKCVQIHCSPICSPEDPESTSDGCTVPVTRSFVVGLHRIELWTSSSSGVAKSLVSDTSPIRAVRKASGFIGEHGAGSKEGRC